MCTEALQGQHFYNIYWELNHSDPSISSVPRYIPTTWEKRNMYKAATGRFGVMLISRWIWIAHGGVCVLGSIIQLWKEMKCRPITQDGRASEHPHSVKEAWHKGHTLEITDQAQTNRQLPKAQEGKGLWATTSGMCSFTLGRVNDVKCLILCYVSFNWINRIHTVSFGLASAVEGSRLNALCKQVQRYLHKNTCPGSGDGGNSQHSSHVIRVLLQLCAVPRIIGTPQSRSGIWPQLQKAKDTG